MAEQKMQVSPAAVRAGNNDDDDDNTRTFTVLGQPLALSLGNKENEELLAQQVDNANRNPPASSDGGVASTTFEAALHFISTIDVDAINYEILFASIKEKYLPSGTTTHSQVSTLCETKPDAEAALRLCSTVFADQFGGKTGLFALENKLDGDRL